QPPVRRTRWSARADLGGPPGTPRPLRAERPAGALAQVRQGVIQVARQPEERAIVEREPAGEDVGRPQAERRVGGLEVGCQTGVQPLVGRMEAVDEAETFGQLEEALRELLGGERLAEGLLLRDRAQD